MNEFRLTFTLMDDSVQQVAHALCKYYLENNCKNIELAVIDLEELADHILAYTRAERKFLEANNR
jgi:hypothetical protein